MQNKNNFIKCEIENVKKENQINLNLLKNKDGIIDEKYKKEDITGVKIKYN
jgi:hypothetical protein